MAIGKGLNTVSIPLGVTELETAGCKLIPFKTVGDGKAKILSYSGGKWFGVTSMVTGKGYYINLESSCTVKFPKIVATDQLADAPYLLNNIVNNLQQGPNFIGLPVSTHIGNFMKYCGDAKEAGKGLGEIFNGATKGRLMSVQGGSWGAGYSMQPYVGYWLWYSGAGCSVNAGSLVDVPVTKVSGTDTPASNAPANTPNQLSAGCAYGNSPLEYKGVKLEGIQNKVSDTLFKTDITITGKTGSPIKDTIESNKAYLTQASGERDSFWWPVHGIKKYDVDGMKLVVDANGGAFLDKDGKNTNIPVSTRLLFGEDIFLCGSVDNRVEGYNAGITIEAPDTFGAGEAVAVKGTIAKAYLSQGRGGTVTLQLYRGVVTPYNKGMAVTLSWIGQVEADASGNWPNSDTQRLGTFKFSSASGTLFKSGVTYTVIANYISNGVDVRAYKYITSK